MNITPTIVTTNFKVTGVLPPTPEYKWNRNVTACVLSDEIDGAISKFRAAYPDTIKIISVTRTSDIHIA